VGFEWVSREIRDAGILGEVAMLHRLHEAGEISDEIRNREERRLLEKMPGDSPVKVIEVL